MLRAEASAPLAAASATASGAALAPDPAKMLSTTCAAGMAAVPGGRYALGELEVSVQPFCLDLTEATAAAYESCVNEGKCRTKGDWDGCNFAKSGRERHPMNCVDWNEAKAFCEAQGKRLPTWAEWEWAARGGDAGRTYPWGSEEPRDRACWSGDSEDRRGTCEVGSFPSGHGRFGHRDLAGNVWEWTASQASSEDAQLVVRGGCYLDNVPKWMSATLRGSQQPSNRGSRFGFRCAR